MELRVDVFRFTVEARKLGILALILLKPCSNFLGFTIGFMGQGSGWQSLGFRGSLF